MNTNTVMLLEMKELEALLWGLAEIGDNPDHVPEDHDEPLAVLLAEGWPRVDIIASAQALEAQVQTQWLREPLTSLDKAVLRVCIENSSWVTAYVELGPAGGTADDCRATLRGLARKLEGAFGVEVNFIAN